MTGLRTLLQGSEPQNPTEGIGPALVLESTRLAFRRYLLVSSGISSTALGLALIISFFASGYGEAALDRLAVEDGSSVRVVMSSGQMESLLLDEAGGAVATPEATPAAEEIVAAAAPAPAINLDSRAEPTREPAVQPGVDAPVSKGRAISPPGLAPIATPAATPRAAVVSQPPAALVSIGRIENVNLTFYDCLDQGFCGRMSSGEKVYEGAAACSWNLPEGTRFRIVDDPTKRIYVCEDRGLLEDTWVDVFFYDPKDGWEWQEAVGRIGTIEITRLP